MEVNLNLLEGFIQGQGGVFRMWDLKVRDGSQTRFWEDTWVDSNSLREQFPTSYIIANYPHVIVANVMNQTPLNISF